jgi:ATP-dependent protease ClpP protease subunit
MAYQKVATLSFAIMLLATSNQTSHGQPGKIIEKIDCLIVCSLSGSKITGTIDSSTVTQLNALIDRVRQRAAKENKDAFKLGGGLMYLSSPGGNVSAAMAIGRILRKHRIRVAVPWNSGCYSSCVLVLAGAVGRDMFRAKIGIHRPYLGSVPSERVSPEKVSEVFQRMLQEMRAYFREMNVSEQLADAMLRIEPHNMRLLSETELDAFGLTETDPIEQETDDLEWAQIYGVDRTEYMRRKSLIERVCPHWVQVDANKACRERILETGK